jgi:hypothetical protein
MFAACAFVSNTVSASVLVCVGTELLTSRELNSDRSPIVLRIARNRDSSISVFQPMNPATTIAAGLAATVYFAMPNWKEHFRGTAKFEVASYDYDYYYLYEQPVDEVSLSVDPVPDVMTTTSTSSALEITSEDNVTMDENATPETNQTLWQQYAPDWIPTQGITISLPYMFIITVLMAEFGRAAVAYFMFVYCRKRIRQRTVMCQTAESYTVIRAEVAKRSYHLELMNEEAHYECKRCSSTLAMNTKCVKRNDSERWTHLCNEFADGFECFEVIKQ